MLLKEVLHYIKENEVFYTDTLTVRRQGDMIYLNNDSFKVKDQFVKKDGIVKIFRRDYVNFYQELNLFNLTNVKAAFHEEKLYVIENYPSDFLPLRGWHSLKPEYSYVKDICTEDTLSLQGISFDLNMSIRRQQ